MASGTKTDLLEGVAVGASALCVLHCLALPVLIAVIPALSSTLSIPESVHLWLLAAAVPTASIALLTGRAVHNRSVPLIIGGSGIALMTMGALVFEGSVLETALTVLGSSLLATAHLINWHRRHGYEC